MPSKRPKANQRVTRVEVVRAECRPEPDWDRFAWAVLQHARIIDERGRGKSESEPPR